MLCITLTSLAFLSDLRRPGTARFFLQFAALLAVALLPLLGLTLHRVWRLVEAGHSRAELISVLEDDARWRSLDRPPQTSWWERIGCLYGWPTLLVVGANWALLSLGRVDVLGTVVVTLPAVCLGLVAAYLGGVRFIGTSETRHRQAGFWRDTTTAGFLFALATRLTVRRQGQAIRPGAA